jgi:predicted DNA-binding transcriptional regulator YafY
MDTITFEDQVLAMVIPADFSEPGVSFFTPNNYSQQLAYMRHPAGRTVRAHAHNEMRREVFRTLEVLFIRKGRLRVDFYQQDGSYIVSYVLGAGDTILLVSGGHGFEMLDEVEMIEVKQGPFAGPTDKTLFEPVAREKIRISATCRRSYP